MADLRAMEPEAAAARPSIRVQRGRILSYLALAAIVLVGLFLRWERLEYAQFFRDQGWSLNRAYEFVTKGDFPLVGITSSVGTAQGPVEILVVALPVAISTDPRLATAFVGLLQVLAVIGTYWLAERYFGRAVGLGAAALYAVNPWALQFGREIWAPNVAPLFTVLFLGSLYVGVVERRRFWFALACFWLAVLFLAHPSGALYGPLVVAVVILYWRRIGPRPLLLGALLALLAMSTYLWYEYQHDFSSLQKFFSTSSAPARVDLEALKYVMAMASARYFPNMMGHSFRGDWSLPDQTVQNELATWLVYLGLAFSLWRALAPRLRPHQYPWQSEPYVLLLLWFAVPILAAAWHSLDYYPYYFVNTLPVQYILIGVGLAGTAGLFSGVIRRWRPDIRWIPSAAVAATVLYLGISQTAFFRTYLDYVQYDEPLGRYCIPLLYSQRAIDGARAVRAQSGNTPVYAYSQQQWEVLYYLGKPDFELREIDPAEGLALPRDPSAGALFILANDDITYSDQKPFVVKEDSRTIERLHRLGYVELEDRAVRGPLGYPYYRLFWLSPENARQTMASLLLPAQLPLANGMRLVGFSVPKEVKASDKLTLAALWEVPEGSRQPGDEYNLFVHGLTSKGEQILGEDWETVQYEHRVWRYALPNWRGDDMPVSFYELEVPADAGPAVLWLDLGAYRRHDRAEAQWVDAGGGQQGAAITAGSLKVLPPSPPAPQVATSHLFGDAFELQGYDVGPQALAAGGTYEIALHWKARAVPQGDYVISVQVLDAAGSLVAQHDSQPVDGRYPTSYWAAGETVVDRHSLALPASLGEGPHQVVVVVYSQQTQARLPVSEGAGATGDYARLATFSPRVP